MAPEMCGRLFLLHDSRPLSFRIGRRRARYRIPQNPEKDWYIDYSIDLKIGRDCCSRNSISFHYVDEDLMRRLYHLTYSCPKEHVDMAYA